MTARSKKEINRYQIIGISLSLLIHGVIILMLHSLGQGLSGKISTITIDVSVLDSVRNAGSGREAAAVPMDGQDEIHPETRVQKKLPESPEKPSRKTSLKVSANRMIEPFVHKKIPMVPLSPPDPVTCGTAEISDNNPHEESLAPESGTQDGFAEDEMHAGSNAASTVKNSFTRSGIQKASGSGEPGLEAHYNLIRGRLQDFLVYPNIAREKGWSGEVMVSFMLLPDGKVNEIRVKKSSGIAVLDQSAMQTIEKASPFPNLPMAARIVIPIVFQLN